MLRTSTRSNSARLNPLVWLNSFALNVVFGAVACWLVFAISLIGGFETPALASPDCERLIKSGKVAAKSELFDEARALYQKAYDDCGDPVALVHIAKAFQDQGRLAEALGFVEQFLAEVKPDHPLYGPLSEAAIELRTKVNEGQGESFGGDSESQTSGDKRTEDSIGTNTGPGESSGNSARRGRIPQDELDLAGGEIEFDERELLGAQPFSILDRAEGRSSVGIFAALMIFTDQTEIQILRIEPHFTFMVSPRVGVIGSLPITVARAAFDGQSDAETGFGNLDVGGFYVHTLSASTELVGRASATLPSASSGDLVVNAIGATARIGDVAVLLPKLVVGRGAVSLNHQPAVAARIRVDVGVDLPLGIVGDGKLDDRDPLFRLSLGASYGDRTRGTVELVNLISTSSNDGDTAIHQLAIGVAHYLDGGVIHGGVSTILDTLSADPKEDPIAISVNYSHGF